jgi:hypothetical protein
MNKLTFLVGALLISFAGYGQKYIADKGKVTFFSHASIEDIAATNEKSSGIYNVGDGEIVLSIPIKEFEFDKSLMKDQFNEKYMESDKFPKATFQGTLSGFQLTAAGAQQAKAVGKLTIHGVTKDVEITGTAESAAGKVTLKSKFIVKLADYKVEIPQLMWKNIAEQVEVTVDFGFKVL